MAARSPADERGSVDGLHGLSAPPARQAPTQGDVRPSAPSLDVLANQIAEIAAQLALIVGDRLAIPPESRHMSDMDRSGQQGIEADIADTPVVEPLLTVADLAEVLQVNPRTVRRWRAEGRLPKSVEIGGCIRWRRDAVEDWLGDQEAR